jgi:phosphoglycerate dehydrogenase-like enzyme
MRDVRVLSTRSFSTPWLDQLRSLSPRLVIEQITVDHAEEVPDSVWETVEVLYTWGALPDPAKAPNLRWVQLDTAGVNHLLDTPLWQSDVMLTTLNGVAPSNMAEFALMMMMAFGHRLPLMLDLQRRHEWPSFQFRWDNFTPHELRGATVGVIGYGAIGRELGRLAHAFGMRVLGMNRSGRSDPRPLTFAVPSLQGLEGGEPDMLYTPAEMQEMMPQCDYVVVIAPYTEATHHLVDEAALRAMKPDAVLVNIARGGVVDETALIRALEEGRIGGAALDVFEEEPLPAESPLWGMSNVIISPHAAGFTSRYYDVIQELFGENLRRYLAGEPLLNQVDRSRQY